MSSELLVEEKENDEHRIPNNLGSIWMVAVHLLYSLHQYFRFEVVIASDIILPRRVDFLSVDLVDVGVNGYFNCIFVRLIDLLLGFVVEYSTKARSVHSVGGQPNRIFVGFEILKEGYQLYV